MSNRSRRFLAAQEATVLADPLDHHTNEAADHPHLPLVPSLANGMPGATDNQRSSRSPRGERERSADTDTAEQSARSLTQVGRFISDSAAKIATWSRQHPLPMIGAAAAILAVSGLVYKLRAKRTARLARVAGAVTRAKSKVKSKVRSKVAKVGKMVRAVTAGRGKRAVATA